MRKLNIWLREWDGEDTRNGQVPPNSTYYLSKKHNRWWERGGGRYPGTTLFPDGLGEVDRKSQQAFSDRMGSVQGPGVALVNIVEAPHAPQKPQGHNS